VAAENLAAAIRAQLAFPPTSGPLQNHPPPQHPARAKSRSDFISERVVIVRILEHFGELKPRATHGTDPRPSWH